MKLLDFKKQNSLLIAAFALSFFSVILLYAVLGIAPFGDKMLILADSESQYTSFWSYLREVFLGRQDPVYAMEKTIGGNIIGLLGYYAASPLNFIFLLFSPEHQPVAVNLIILLKLSLCSLTMAVYFKYDGELKKSSLLFTTAYAFCAYTVSYCWSAMWIDGVVLLPLIAVGLQKIAAGEKPWLYILSLWLGIISCYYIGYILCAFSVLYFIYLLYVEYGGLKKLAGASGSFLLSSLCAGVLSAFVLVPVLLAQTDSKRIPFSGLFTNYTYTRSLMFLEMICPERAAEFDSLVKYVLLAALAVVCVICFALLVLLRAKKVSWKLKIVAFAAAAVLLIAYGAVFESSEHFLHKLLVGFTNYDEMFDGLPGIYSGLLVLILALAYFVMPEISARRRVGAAFFVAMLLVSMRFYIPNLMWHGFTENNCFGYRYSFVFSFFLICLAKEAFDKGKFRPVHALLAIGFTAMLVAIAYNSHPKLAETWQYVLISSVMVLLCTALLAMSKAKFNKTAAAAIAVLHFASVLYVPYVSWSNYTEGTSYSAFRNRAEVSAELTAQMKQADSGLYRANVDSQINAPMMFGFNGTSHFSSNEEGFVVDFMHKLGVSTAGSIWADGNLGRTNALMSFLGVKYYADGSELEEFEFALPMAFLADAEVVNAELDSANAFENLNKLFSNVYPNEESQVFSPIKAEKEYIHLQQFSDDSYIVEDGFDEGEIVYSFTAQSADPLYFYSDGCVGRGGELYLNGEYLDDYSVCYGWRIFDLGSYAPGEEIRLSVKLHKDSEFAITDTGRFCHESMDSIRVYYEAVTQQKCLSYSETDSEIFTELNAEKDGQYLLYTVPYDSSWTVLVDGEPVEAEKAFGTLLAVPIDSGEHVVHLQYKATGIVTGILISAVGLVSLLAAVCLGKRKNK